MSAVIRPRGADYLSRADAAPRIRQTSQAGFLELVGVGRGRPSVRAARHPSPP